MRISGVLFLFLLFYSAANAQLGGKQAYTFLDLSPSSRAASLGGNLITVKDHDVSIAYLNPASITRQMHGQLSMAYFNYFAGVNVGMANYAHHFKKAGTFNSGIQYFNYGKFTLADETSVQQGNFTASDYCIYTGYSKMLDSSFTIGANLKGIFSQYEIYKSSALAMDFAAMYHRRETKFTATFLIRQAGAPLKSYVSGVREKLPLELLAGVSKGLAHVPITFHFTFSNLQKWDLRPTDSLMVNNTLDPLAAQAKEKRRQMLDIPARHITGAVEIAPAKAFAIRIGYDYRRRQELKLSQKPGLVGFSFGFGVKIKSFRFDYGRIQYHLAGASNLFTITMPITGSRNSAGQP